MISNPGSEEKTVVPETLATRYLSEAGLRLLAIQFRSCDRIRLTTNCCLFADRDLLFP